MDAISYTYARKNLAQTMSNVAVVMMSMEDYESLNETAYLLRSPRNVRRLLESIEELESGEGKERILPE